MELTDGNVATLSTYLQQTLSPTREERIGAEKFLQSVETNAGYSILLLMVTSKENVPMPIRVSAAVNFKNFVKRNWRVVDDADKIPADDRLRIKTMIVDLMISMPEQIQRQLSDSISIIGREDFPKAWPDLLKHMITKIAGGDFHVINGILRTAHSLFKRYRHEFKSQELWSEIKIVLDEFAAPLTDLFKKTMDLAQTPNCADNVIKIVYSSILMICKIFYSLNYQDLPEYFEDNMGVWFTHFLFLIQVDNKALASDSDEEPGTLELLKAQVCDNFSLYVEKYDSDCKDYIPRLFEAAYNLLLKTSMVPKNDILVSRGLEFLATVISKSDMSQQFADEAVLKKICHEVVVPNVEFRPADEEVFEDNPEEFIRRDIEGSDVDTRRRAASDLVKALCKSNEAQVMALIGSYVQVLLGEYATNPEQKWKMKDSAIYLVTSVVAKGQTQKHGITQVSELVNINDFFATQILPELNVPDVNKQPVLKASAIKYVMTFRTVLAKEVLVSSLPFICNFLKSDAVVVHSYAAHTLERIFTIPGPNGQGTLITPQDIPDPTKQVMIQNLFGIFAMAGSNENEYAMKAIMRTLSLLQDQAIAFMEHILNTIVTKMIEASGNPSKPNFNHYLFETLTLSIRIMCKANPKAVQVFEAQLFPPFQEILQKDVLEFHPYVFQVLSLLLEQHGEAGIPDTYMALYPFLLTPVLWDRPGNIPPLVRLLQAFVEKGSAQIIGGDGSQLNSLLGVFQKLISSKTNDHQGFYLLQSLITMITLSQLTAAHAKSIMILLFTRLSRSKTAKFVKSFLVFLNLFAVRYGGTELIELVDSVQPNMWVMVVDRLISLETQKVSGAVEKKICSVGMTKLLCETAPMSPSGKYFAQFSPVLDASIRLLQLPTDETDADDEHFIDVEDTPGYQAAFCQLSMAGKKDFDPFKGAVPCPKTHLLTNLQKFSAQFPGKLLPAIQQMKPECQAALQEWIGTAGITLS